MTVTNMCSDFGGFRCNFPHNFWPLLNITLSSIKQLSTQLYFSLKIHQEFFLYAINIFPITN